MKTTQTTQTTQTTRPHYPTYNCAGYAFGTYNWYIPWHTDSIENCIKSFEMDFGIKAQQVESLDSPNFPVVLVRFKLENDGSIDDFHCLRVEGPNQIFHKWGRFWVEQYEYNPLDTSWTGGFDSPIYVFELGKRKP